MLISVFTFISRKASKKKYYYNSWAITGHINCSGGDLEDHNEYFVTPPMLHTLLHLPYNAVKNVIPSPLPPALPTTEHPTNKKRIYSGF
jgi:hypothetical protein